MLCGDGVGCAGCVRAHLYCQNDKVVVMCGGRTAISRRVQEKKKPRLLVDVEDQLLPKPMSKCLRARACSKRQQLIDRLQPHLRLASQTFSRCASLLLLHRPATPATNAGWFGVATETIRWKPEDACPARRWPEEKEMCRVIFSHFGLFRHGSRVTAELRALLYTALKKAVEQPPRRKSPM